MPKNIKGGKKGRRGKNEIEERFFEQKEPGQAYALVTQYFGNGRVEVNCFIEKEPEEDKDESNDKENKEKEKEFENQKKLGIIRGTMRKRKYKNNVTVGSVVIVGIREYEDGKCDIMHVYNNDEVRRLRRMGEIPNVAVEAGSNGEIVNEEDYINFFDEHEMDEESEDDIENI